VRTPSRKMPKYLPARRRWLVWPLAVALVSGLVYAVGLFVVSWPWIAVPLLALGAAHIYFDVKRAKRQLTQKLAAREGESICQFARSFDCRRVDTWIIRAVYEALQAQVPSARPMPIRAIDSLAHDLGVDDEDLEWVAAEEVARRTGRSMIGFERNPYYGKVRTAADLVHFFNQQPRVAP
jgi:hypothetical protein